MGKKVVVVGMSGGVDSSVSALLLKQQGFEVIGLFMKNWQENDPSGQCLAAKDQEDVARVCSQIDIPFYTVNFTEPYWDRVFSRFLQELKLGYTPNPDILCNREIKFNLFLEKAFSLGADYLATGHYAQTQEGRLFRGLDPNKDQSYFLSALKSENLENVLFPIGHLNKTDVRSYAQKHRLATAEKKDSTGICFIGKRDFGTFLSRYIPYQEGDFRTLCGKLVGKHRGTAYYTIGQRKGLEIGGPGEAWFVVKKDVETNTVFVEQGEDHPSLYSQELTATEASWVRETPSFPLSCTAKIRYRQPDQSCLVSDLGHGRLHVAFSEKQRAVTPRQSVAFYQGTQCLGSAFIE